MISLGVRTTENRFENLLKFPGQLYTLRMVFFGGLFWYHRRFKGVKIDGAPRVTKLNRIFRIILLLLKEKETLWKIVFPHYGADYPSKKEHAAAVAGVTGTVIYEVKVRQYLPDTHGCFTREEGVGLWERDALARTVRWRWMVVG